MSLKYDRGQHFIVRGGGKNCEQAPEAVIVNECIRMIK